jgi:hypothetical protein
VAFAKFPCFLTPFRSKIILNNRQTRYSATNICSLADIWFFDTTTAEGSTEGN